jgi:hypothetical protein
LAAYETKEEIRERRINRARKLLKDRTPLILNKYPKSINMHKPLDETVAVTEGDGVRKIEWAYSGKG